MKRTKLDPSARKPKSITVFKNNILKILRQKPNCIFAFHYPKEIKLLTRLNSGYNFYFKFWKHSYLQKEYKGSVKNNFVICLS